MRSHLRIRRLVVAVAVLGLMAFATAAGAQGPMIEINLNCDGIGDITVESNPAHLWAPGHVSSDDPEVTHIVTGIFGFEKGQTNDNLPFGTIECTVVGGPLDGLVVTGFFVPRGGPPA